MSYKKTIIVGFTLFGFVILVGLVTFYISLGKCPSSGLLCDSGNLCLPQNLVCDHVVHCQDSSDESKLRCGNFYGPLEYNINERENGIKSFDQLNATFKFKTYKEYKYYCKWNSSDIIGGCECRIVNLISCQRMNLTKIPNEIPNDVVKLILGNNQIELQNQNHEEKFSFKKYQNLTILQLFNNNISLIPEKFFHDANRLRKLYLFNNRIRRLPRDLFDDENSLVELLLNDNLLEDFDLHVLGNLQRLSFLNMSQNYITMKQMHFPKLNKMNELFIDFNRIEFLKENSFKFLTNLRLLSLRFNRIKVIESSTFEHLHRLQELRLSDNPIHKFESRFFTEMPELRALYFDNLKFPMTESLLTKLNVSFLSLNGIPRRHIDFNALAKIPNLKSIVFKKFSYCSMISNIELTHCRPKTDGVSSDAQLLARPILRYSTWTISFLTCVGNLLVLWGRFKYRDENRSVSLVIRNLAFSDFIMGIYLASVGLKDFLSRDEYRNDWVKSWQCTMLGALSVVSSEVSLLILTFMCIERFLLISDPFGHHRLNTKNIVMCLYIIWLVGIFIAIFPILLYSSSTKFYGFHNGATCFPLFVYERFATGWEYSALIFIGINFTLLLLIATLYTALLFSIWKTRRATTLSFDCEFAIRFFFIVLTDSTCWAPIIVFKFLAFTSIELSSDVYAWLVVFILPLNSVVNPLLYTFTTPKYRDQIYKLFAVRRSFIKKQESTSHQLTADESHAKIAPLFGGLSSKTSSLKT